MQKRSRINWKEAFLPFRDPFESLKRKCHKVRDKSDRLIKFPMHALITLCSNAIV